MVTSSVAVRVREASSDLVEYAASDGVIVSWRNVAIVRVEPLRDIDDVTGPEDDDGDVVREEDPLDREAEHVLLMLTLPSSSRCFVV